MTTYFDQKILVFRKDDSIVLAFADVRLVMPIDVASEIANKITELVGDSDLILRPNKPDYRVGESESIDPSA